MVWLLAKILKTTIQWRFFTVKLCDAFSKYFEHWCIENSKLNNSTEDCYDFTKFNRVEIGKMGDCTRAGMGPGDAGMNNEAGAGNGYKCK